MMEARYRYRLRVTPTQADQLQGVFDSCRFVWNTALGRWTDLWRYEGLRFSTTDACAELTDWRGRFVWLASQPCAPQQQVLRDLGKSVSAFFDKSNPAGRPRFKRKKAVTSARWTYNKFAVSADHLIISVAGGRIPLRVVWSRPLPSVPKSVTVYRDATGKWWASFVVRIEAEALSPSGRTTGLDVGLTTYATTEYLAADVANPRLARNAAKMLARAQRNFARKKKGSNNRAKAKVSTAKVHAKVKNQRVNFHQTEARKLARSFDRIGVEKLQVSNMVRRGKGRKKVGLNRSISDAAWGQFLNTLEWQAKKCGHEVVRLNSRNTTQNCSACGTKAKVHVGLKQRIFVCSECGLTLCRDLNAARNLNPDRWDKSVRVGQGDDGIKPSGLRTMRQPEPQNPRPVGRELSSA